MAYKQYIIFKLNDEKYAAEISNIASITDYSSITTLPNGPSYIDGLLNLRGDIIPVINLKKRFNLADNQMKEKRIIIARRGDTQIGFLVDDASQSMSVESDQVLPPPVIAIQKSNRYISEVCIKDNELIVVIDLEKVLTDDEVEEIMELA
ncbi:chemotaxis protein CheW [Fusibacter tunisiensis]|uniref:Purine-binding chemotaxis protein CheW n=1 Tax=Fusibacter tunisiensis TaxID=1008308 RepID=A0ABS2MSL9_9FIRM|nr:chemotaxis protein CheW [Fusibacter tunisiensis]MBM7562399.1 purine-binding chemotaxis protein CheW [Fusibacter tunisiensis]